MERADKDLSCPEGQKSYSYRASVYKRSCITFLYGLKPLTQAHSQQQAWLSSKSDLIKLSDNLHISRDLQGLGYWWFVEVALG